MTISGPHPQPSIRACFHPLRSEMKAFTQSPKSRCWSLEGSDPAIWQPRWRSERRAALDAAKVLVVIEAVPMAGFCLLNGGKKE